ncbi:MAG: methyltransferase domain-containing protein [Flavobacteriaceae bacterium]
MNFDQRIDEEEIMDQATLEPESLAGAYRDINRSNELLGGYAATFKALRHQMDTIGQSGPIRILDMGCGDGGMLRYLAKRFKKLNLDVEYLGLDLNTDAISLARENSKDFPEIKYNVADIMEYQTEAGLFDYVLCTLTLHHFSDEDIPRVISVCQNCCKRAVIINDLQRSQIAYYLFKFFSAIFIGSAVARNDGLVSIRKAFRKVELFEISKRFPNWEHSIKWNWAYRYVWVIKNKRPTPS